MHRTAVWQHSGNSNINIAHNSIEHFFWNPSDFSSDDVHKFCRSSTPSENRQVGWDLGNRMARDYRFDVKWVCTMERYRFDAKWICPMGGYAWGIQVFCSVREMRRHLISRTEHLNTSGITSHGTDSFHVKLITPGHPIPKISTRLTIFWGGTWKTEFVKTIHRQERTSSEKKSDGLHKKCSIELWTILLFELLLCCHTAARCMERT